MYAAKYQLIKIMLHRYGKLLIAVFQPKKDQSNANSQDPEYIANEFNQFFVAVSGKTANATVQVVLNNNLDVSILNSNPVTLREHTSHERFQLSPVSCTDIKRIIITMPSNKSPGPDKVRMNVLKDCLPVVLGPITNIINCSFATSVSLTNGISGSYIHVKRR